jgi:PAS domain S-box-containing protein
VRLGCRTNPRCGSAGYRGRLEDYLATASDWLWETDEGHRFVFDGDGMAKSNVRPDRLIGHTRWELAGVADPRADPVWRAHLADLEARRPFRRFEYGALDEDGRPVHFEVNGTPVFDAAGAFRGYRGTASNVTARKQAEEARRESEARLRDFADVPRTTVERDTL